jgi:hypothetical protein
MQGQLGCIRCVVLVVVRPRHQCRCLSARIPPIVRLRDIGSGWTLGVTILAVVKAVFGGCWNAERRAKAIALYIGAAAKWARIKLHVTHVAQFSARAAKPKTVHFTVPAAASFQGLADRIPTSGNGGTVGKGAVYKFY